MPQVENEQEKDNDETLRQFIDRLENWPEDEPPSPAELRALRREIRLTESDRDKLELLAENHIRRARTALAGNSYDQAAAELARASQLRPMDSRPRVELAEVYLQRSLERGYGRNDRNRAIKLARKALELNPGDAEARHFLQEYRRMNADFLAVKYRRFIIPVLVLILLLGAMVWWQQEWIINLVQPDNTVAVPPSDLNSPGTSPESRTIGIEAAGLTGGNLDTEIIQAIVGRQNDASYVKVQGRLRSTNGYLGGLKLLVRGRDSDGNTLFAMPWTVRDSTSPVLIPGDSEVLLLFRWLADSETEITSLELAPFEMEIPDSVPIWTPTEPVLVWDAARPDGAALTAEVRNFKMIEGYDRQVILMDLALENTGVGNLNDLSLGISLGSDLPTYTHNAVNPEEPGLTRGERRVWALAMSVPLDADMSDRIVTVRIKDLND